MGRRLLILSQKRCSNKTRAEDPDESTSKYVLKSESRVETFQQIRQRADDLGLSSDQRKNFGDIIDISEQFIAQQSEDGTDSGTTGL